MDRDTLTRTLIAGVVIVAIMVVWNKYVEPYFWPSPPPVPARAPVPPAVPPPAAPTGEKPPADKPPVPAPPAAPVLKAPAIQAAGAAEAPAHPVVLGSAAYDSPYDLEAEVTAKGAAVQRLVLARHDFFRTVADRHLARDERAPMELVESAATAAFTIPELRVRLKGAEDWSAVDLSDVLWKVEAEKTTASAAVFSVEVRDAEARPLLTVRKTFTLQPRSQAAGTRLGEQAVAPPAAGLPYEMQMKVELVAVDERVERVDYQVQGPPALPEEGGRGGAAMAVAGKWDQGRIKIETLGAKELKRGDPLPERQDLGGPEVAWIGNMDKYFAVILIPQKPLPGGTFAVGAKTAWVAAKRGGREAALPVGRLLLREMTPVKGRAPAHEYVVYAGPKDVDHLEKHYGDLGLAQLIQWGSCCGIPGIAELSRWLVKVLDAFHALVLNYGLAIMLLVIVLRVALFPISRWSTKSMLEMQKVAPKIQEIREKHKDDQKRMQEEMAKAGGLKAFGGCLPMFLQMPIWVALYGALGAAIQLRHAPLLPSAWVPQGSLFLQDLAAPDALVHWQTPVFLPGHDMPLLGFVVTWIEGMLTGGPGIGLTNFNLLPVLMAGAMYLQQRLTPQPAAATGPQAQQQKQMMVFMMIFMSLILYSAPSGLCLYIFTSSILGFFEQRYLKKKLAVTSAPAAETPKEGAKAAPPAAKKLMVGGREKTFPERIRDWAERLLTPKGRPPDDENRRGK